MNVKFDGDFDQFNKVNNGHRATIIDLELENGVYNIGWTLIRFDKKLNKVTARPDKEYLIHVQHKITEVITVLNIKPSEVFVIDNLVRVGDKTASGILHLTNEIKFKVEIKVK